MARLRAFTLPELQTVGYLIGLGVLVWWVVGGSNPPAQVVGVVASLLFIQRLFPVKKESKHATTVGDVAGVGESSERGDEPGDAGSRPRVDRRRFRRHPYNPLTTL